MTHTRPRYTYHRSRGSIQIVPANRAGWLGLGAWLLALLAGTGLFIWIMANIASGPAMTAATIIFLLASILWSIAMIRWMKARSEIVDLDELLAIKRERDRQSGRPRP